MKSSSAAAKRLRPAPKLGRLAARFDYQARGIHTIAKFSQRLPEEPSQPNPIGRCLDLGQGSCDLEHIDGSGSHTGASINSIPDCRQTGHDDFDLVQATLTDFNCAGRLFDQLQCLDYEAGDKTARPKP